MLGPPRSRSDMAPGAWRREAAARPEGSSIVVSRAAITRAFDAWTDQQTEQTFAALAWALETSNYTLQGLAAPPDEPGAICKAFVHEEPLLGQPAEQGAGR